MRYNRSFSTITEDEAAELLVIALNHNLPKTDRITKDELIFEIHHNDGGLMMDNDCAIVIDFGCRCFEGQLAICKNGDLNLHDTEKDQPARLFNQLKMFSYLASRNFKVIQNAGFIG